MRRNLNVAFVLILPLLMMGVWDLPSWITTYKRVATLSTLLKEGARR